MPNFVYHLMAIFVVAVWGVTFVSTKVLINYGLSPQEIFILRFIVAYLGIWLVSPKNIFAKNKKDEFLLFLGGLTGGSLYFLTENTALGITQSTNVSLIICTAPLLTTMLSVLFYKEEKVTRKLLIGSVMALCGVGLLVFNGSFILNISPLGDFLTLLAALAWAFYCLVIRKVGDRYHSVFITRKVFFYGILTSLPMFLINSWQFPLEGLLKPVVSMNLLFLSLVASLGCFLAWNIVVKHLGTIITTHYLYLDPLFTIVCASIVLGEKLTVFSAAGIILILFGLIMAARK